MLSGFSFASCKQLFQQGHSLKSYVTALGSVSEFLQATDEYNKFPEKRFESDCNKKFIAIRSITQVIDTILNGQGTLRVPGIMCCRGKRRLMKDSIVTQIEWYLDSV